MKWSQRALTGERVEAYAGVSLMPGRAGTIFLSFVVLIANALCACAGPMTSSVTKSPDAIPAHPGCHGHGDDDEAPASEEVPQHDCGHCTNTVIADAPASKTVDLSLSLAFDLPAYSCGAVLTSPFGSTNGHAAHSGLPPPLGPPTLLSLSCSLNN